MQDSLAARNAHVPVLCADVVKSLQITESGHYLDGTVGMGGHAEAILKSAPGCSLCGLDRDPEALHLAGERLSQFGDRVHLFHMPFDEFDASLARVGWKRVNGALLDLGVSSWQLDNDRRGFSFRGDGPLDMRMDQGKPYVKASELVNRSTYAELRDWISTYGEEPQAGRIARQILSARQKKNIETTRELAEIVYNAYPPAWRKTARRHPATRTFQALRMVVNDELGQLRRFLEKVWQYLAPGGRLAIISFHSLEDRMVKHTMRKWITPEKDELGRNLPDSAQGRLLYKKPLVPQTEELDANPRASSAKLRVIERTDA